VILRETPEALRVEIDPRSAPVVLVSPGEERVKVQGSPRAASREVGGMDPGRRALRVWVPGFGGEPDAAYFRLPVQACVSYGGAVRWRDEMTRATHVVVKARAGEERSNAVEVVLLERDGAPWGTVVALTEDWRAIRVPLSAFRFFDHWHHPAGRGGATDRLDPGRIEAVNFCFGAWLYGAVGSTTLPPPRGEDAGRPHAVEIQDVGLVTARMKQEE
jgi:hypothetical protein